MLTSVDGRSASVAHYVAVMSKQCARQGSRMTIYIVILESKHILLENVCLENETSRKRLDRSMTQHVNYTYV